MKTQARFAKQLRQGFEQSVKQSTVQSLSLGERELLHATLDFLHTPELRVHSYANVLLHNK